MLLLATSSHISIGACSSLSSYFGAIFLFNLSMCVPGALQDILKTFFRGDSWNNCPVMPGSPPLLLQDRLSACPPSAGIAILSHGAPLLIGRNNYIPKCYHGLLNVYDCPSALAFLFLEKFQNIKKLTIRWILQLDGLSSDLAVDLHLSWL